MIECIRDKQAENISSENKMKINDMCSQNIKIHHIAKSGIQFEENFSLALINLSLHSERIFQKYE